MVCGRHVRNAGIDLVFSSFTPRNSFLFGSCKGPFGTIARLRHLFGKGPEEWSKAMRKAALLGIAVLLCGAGAAQAQYYSDDRPAYYYDREAGETVIVRPNYDRVEKRQLVGRINGEVNPTEYSLARPVDFSDLDLTRYLDRLELRDRVRHAARDMCTELEVRVPQLRGDPSADRECVRTAIRNAMRDALG